MPSTRVRRPGGWSIRHRLLVAYAVLALVVAGIVIAVTVTLKHVDDSVDKRANVVQPAEIRNAQLLSALLDQETGIRGIAVTGNGVNLQAYGDGLQAEKTAVGYLDGYFKHYPLFYADLREVERRAGLWRQQYAEPVIKAVGLSGPGAAAQIDPSLAGKAQFDAIRQASTKLDNDLLSAARQAKSQLSNALHVLIGLLGGSVVLLVIAVFVVYYATRRWVTVPLDKVGRDSRQVAEGDLEHRVAPVGPADIQELAADIDAMRDKLLAEITERERNRSQLLAQTDLLRQQADDLARSNRDLEQFAYVASHDLQEPLRKVASFCQLLERRYSGSLDERGEQYIAYAVDGAKRMQELINALLAFSRVGRTTDRFVEVSLDDALKRAVASLTSAIETKAVVNADPLPTVRGDLGLLTQLFQNLVGNGIKFRREDTPVITVSSRQAGEFWEITVADNGIGIEAEYAEKIFVIFQRLHGRDAYAGTGIGLALCRRIVEFHGGTIALDTAHGGPGSVFRFTLPVHGADPVGSELPRVTMEATGAVAEGV